MLRFVYRTRTVNGWTNDVLPRECLKQGKGMDDAGSAGESREPGVLCATTQDVATGAGRANGNGVAPQPFAWQNENRVLLFDVDRANWLIAELTFDPDACLYTEVRRASYDSLREAIGAFLSRAMAGGEMALIDAVEKFDRYMTRHYRVGLINA